MSKRTFTLRHSAIALAAGTALLFAGHACAASYRNDDFDFSAELPTGLKVCTALPYAHDRGFTLLLRRGGCGDSEPDHDWIDVLSDLNTVFDARDRHDLAKAICGDAAVTPDALTAGGLLFDSCGPIAVGDGDEVLFVGLRADKVTEMYYDVVTVVTVDASAPALLPDHMRIAEQVMRSFVFW